MQHQAQDAATRDERLERLEQLVERQQQTIAQLEAHTELRLEPPEPRMSRRRLLAGAGAAAAGAVAGAIATAAPAGATAVTAGAADGDALQIGGNNTNTTLSTTGGTKLEGSTQPGAFRPMFSVIQTAQGNAAIYAQYAGLTQNYGVLGDAIAGDADSSGVTGRRTAGTLGVGVDGQAFTPRGVGVRARSGLGAGLQIVDDSVAMPPTTSTWVAGQFVVSGGQVWYCYLGGVGTASKWVRLSSSFVPLAAPVRIYYSLTAGDPPLGSGQQRDVPVTNGTTIPHSASAVLTNLAVTPAGTGGFLAMFKDGAWPGTSNLNFAAGEFASNNATSAVVSGSPSTVRVYCGGASVHFVVDVLGYYL